MIPNKFRRGECQGARQSADAKARSLQNAQVISTASLVGRFHFLPLEAALCSDPNQRIRTSGRQARRGGIARCLARETTNETELYAYGNMRRIFFASDGSTCTDRRKWRMRFGFFVPSKWRLNACGRMIFPVFVTRNRFAAPRCVFSLRTFGFAFDNSAPVALSQFRNSYACPPAPAGFPATAPFFGANNASKIFASMRGPNSTCACSPISFSSRDIFARPTS